MYNVTELTIFNTTNYVFRLLSEMNSEQKIVLIPFCYAAGIKKKFFKQKVQQQKKRTMCKYSKPFQQKEFVSTI